MIYDGGLIGGSFFNYCMFFEQNGQNYVLVFTLTGAVLVVRSTGAKIILSKFGGGVISSGEGAVFSNNFREFLFSGISLQTTNSETPVDSENVFTGRNNFVVFYKTDTWYISYNQLQSSVSLPAGLDIIRASVSTDQSIIIVHDDNSTLVPVQLSTNGGSSFAPLLDMNFNNTIIVKIYSSGNYALFGRYTLDEPAVLLLKVYGSGIWTDVAISGVTDMDYADENTIILLRESSGTYYMHKYQIDTDNLAQIATLPGAPAYQSKITIEDNKVFVPQAQGLLVYDLAGSLISTIDFSSEISGLNPRKHKVFMI